MVAYQGLTYALITPVRDEAEAIPRLAESVFSQSACPRKWIIVDTGSTDNTPHLIRRLADRAPWVVPASIDEAAQARGGPIVRAFSHGLELVVPPTDVVVKLDADITIPPTFFENIIGCFAAIEDLGIAGGSLHELEGGAWRQRHGTDNFVRGACRAYRWQCLAGCPSIRGANRLGWSGPRESPDWRLEDPAVPRTCLSTSSGSWAT